MNFEPQYGSTPGKSIFGTFYQKGGSGFVLFGKFWSRNNFKNRVNIIFQLHLAERMLRCLLPVILQISGTGRFEEIGNHRFYQILYNSYQKCPILKILKFLRRLNVCES